MHSPMPAQDLGVLAVFAVVAEERSFTRASVRLGVSRSAVSHAMQALEERLGLRLLARTTRAVAVTEAGQLRQTPAGVVRLIAPPIVLSTLLSPKLATFTRTSRTAASLRAG